MDRFVVPQFIDVEDKIIGPISTRQFVLLLVPALLGTLFFKIFDFTLFLVATLPLIVFFGILAFYRVNGMPIHFFMLNFIQSLRKANLRIWDKVLSEKEIHARIKRIEKAPPPTIPTKAPLSSSRLNELTLIVNTGGVYQGDEE